ncbi:lysophospholipid acyltransferase family protein [Planctomicrobium sp. SH664]|uniref:lysophospholipid acyltransferase family protein n=1 Tax=Planctomicrobium sp. SH664 TaxID=3448125 RepID=UPI003F5BAB81
MTAVGASSHPQQRNWLWRFCQSILQPLFVIWNRYRVRGFEHLPTGGCLLLVNHQSFLDPLFAAAGLDRPVSYLARHNLFQVPVLGWILRNTYVMPIRREAAGTESIRLSVDRLQQGFYVGMFPEGTRGRGGVVGDIKPGFLAIARRVDVPIVPVGIAGADGVMPRGALWPRPAKICVVYGEPLEPALVKELTQRGREAEFAAMVRQRLQACVDEAERWRNGE